MNPIDYYVLIDDQECGPYSIPMLRELLEAKRIDRETLYAREGMKEWEPIRRIELQIFAAPKTVTTPAVGVSASSLHPAVGPAPAPARPFAGRMSPLLIGGLAAVLIFVLLLVFRTKFGSAPVSAGDGGPQEDQRFLAYHNAEIFIKQSYPDAQNISPFSQAVIRQESNTYYVAVAADGSNAVGGPVRAQIGLIMSRTSNAWTLDHIERR